MPRKRKPAPAGIRVFRSDIAKLKKAGLVSPSVDARKIKPTRHYTKKIHENIGVILGKQTTVKVSRKQSSVAKDSGLRVVNNRVIIDKTPGMRVKKDKEDPYGYTIDFSKSTIQSFNFHPGKNVTLKTLEKEANKAWGEHRIGDQYAFTINGNHSRQTFPNVESSIRYAEKVYRISKQRQRDIMFTLYRLKKTEVLKWHPKRKSTKKRKTK